MFHHDGQFEQVNVLPPCQQDSLLETIALAFKMCIVMVCVLSYTKAELLRVDSASGPVWSLNSSSFSIDLDLEALTQDSTWLFWAPDNKTPRSAEKFWGQVRSSQL